jgi:serine-type D-Ala-D-Ala carboxypeptidase (penicillin-binding protein 5/6)
VLNRLFSTSILLLPVLFSSPAGSIGYTVDTIDVGSFYLEDRKTSKIILSKNRKVIYPAASTIKLVTAMVAMKHLRGKSIVKVPGRAALIEPTKAYLRRGEKFRVKDLISALLIKSANDAAVTLAIRTSGSEKKFSRLMNSWCRENKIKNTYCADSTGISHRSVSNAEDLAKIFKIFISDRKNLEIFRKRKGVITSIRGRKIKFHNSNNLHIYRNESGGVLVGKTGFTKRAGYCFTGIVYFGKNSYSLTVMGASMAWHGIGILMNHANELYRENKI